MTTTAVPRASGLRGLVGLVLPIAVLLAIGAGGAERSLLVLAPLVTYALPVVAMIAFWWDDWPGTRLRPSWSGWADTALVALGGVLLTALGQVVTDGLDVRALFHPFPGPGHVPTFPSTMALAGAVFVATLELTLVGEGWPLRGLPPVLGGVLALAAAWAIGLIAYWALGGVPGAELGAALVLVGAWQVLFYVLWLGWPFAGIASRPRRLVVAHAVTIGAGVATFVALHALGVATVPLAAATGCFIGVALVVGMLFEGAFGRASGLLASVVLTAALFLALRAVADTITFRRAAPDEWVEHVGLNALAVSTILHVAIGRRWPFGDRSAARPGR